MSRTYDRVTYQVDQDLRHSVICRAGDHDFRISIRLNTFAEQSYVKCEVWCIGQGWKEWLMHPTHVYEGLCGINHRSLSSQALPILAAVEGKVLALAEEFFLKEDDWEDE